MPSWPVSKNQPLLDAWRKTLNDEIVRSPCTPIDEINGTLVERTLKALKSHAKFHPEKHAAIDAFNQNHVLTYQQIHDQALSVAAFLKSRGFGVGDRATAVLRNCIEFPTIHLGVWAAGGTFVGCSAAYSHDETVYQLSDSASTVVFTSESLLDSVLKAVEHCPRVKTVIYIRSSSSELPENVIDFNDVIATPPLTEIVPVSMDDPCMIYYSSGTTGRPKGVIHTNRTYHSNIETIRSHFLHEIYPVLGVAEVDWYQDCQIIYTACCHIMGFGLLNWCLLTGAPVILMERPDEVLYPKLVEKYKPRYASLTPPLFSYLAKDPVGQKASLESMQLIICAAAPLSQEVSVEFLAHHPTVRFVVQAYGMTETGASHYPLLLHEGANASSGVPASGYSQKLVVPGSNKPCKPGDWGEICVKGPGITIGYLNKPEATQQLFDENGWLHTGDIGYLDPLGCIRIVDRVKEMMKVYYAEAYEYRFVAPADIEGVLLSTPSIRDAAIVGIPNESGGELIRAFIVKAEDSLTEADVEQIAADKLAPYKRISGGIVFLEAIPRNSTGKIMRRELREKY